MAVEVTMPGYKMPEGADVSTEEGFRAWVDSVHPAFASSHLADRLIDEGYNSIASVYHISETQLIGVSTSRRVTRCSLCKRQSGCVEDWAIWMR